jgi:hypothetical protein
MILPGATKETLIIQSHHGHVEKCVGSVPGKTLFRRIYAYTHEVHKRESSWHVNTQKLTNMVC